jgi:hypothetical protein
VATRLPKDGRQSAGEQVAKILKEVGARQNFVSISDKF